MSKSMAITLIILLSILCFAVAGVMIFFLVNKNGFNFVFHFDGYSETLVEKKTFETINDIYVDSKNMDVLFENTSDDKITVELYSEKEEEHTFTENEEKITIKAEIKNHGWVFMQKASRLIIKIPNTFENDLIVESGVGDIKFENLPNITTSIKVGTGDVKIDELNKVTATIGVGDFKAEKVKIANIIIGTGDIKISNIDVIEATSGIGDIKITNLNNKCTIDSSTGDVKIETATITEESSISNKTGDVKIRSLSGAYVDAKTNIGDTKVNNSEEDRKSDIVLKINNNIGDIKVNYN